MCLSVGWTVPNLLLSSFVGNHPKCCFLRRFLSKLQKRTKKVVKNFCMIFWIFVSDCLVRNVSFFNFCRENRELLQRKSSTSAVNFVNYSCELWQFHTWNLPPENQGIAKWCWEIARNEGFCQDFCRIGRNDMIEVHLFRYFFQFWKRSFGSLITQRRANSRMMWNHILTVIEKYLDRHREISWLSSRKIFQKFAPGGSKRQNEVRTSGKKPVWEGISAF